jgi:hypothetical protein
MAQHTSPIPHLSSNMGQTDLILIDPHTREEYDIGELLRQNNNVTMGRHFCNTVRLPVDNLNLSRHHAIITPEGDGDAILFTPLSTLKATYMDGTMLKPYQEYELVSGNILTFGTPHDNMIDQITGDMVYNYTFHVHVKARKRKRGIQSETMDNITCAICIDVIAAAHSLECSHIFCGTCIWRALKSKNACPLCRRPCRNMPVAQPLMQTLITEIVDAEQQGSLRKRASEFKEYLRSSEYALTERMMNTERVKYASELVRSHIASVPTSVLID